MLSPQHDDDDDVVNYRRYCSPTQTEIKSVQSMYLNFRLDILEEEFSQRDNL